MKQICKRLSAIFLVLAVVSSSVLVTGIVAQADTNQDCPSGYLLYDNNFDTDTSLEDAGIYTNDETNSISDGCFNLKVKTFAYLSEVVDASDWTDYTVEADVKLIQPEGDTTTKGYAGIVARSTNRNAKGYEFLMYYNGNGTTQLHLQKRNGAEGDLGEPKDLKKTIAFTLNEYHEMKMTVQGNKITCFFDGKEAFTVEDKGTAYTTGYAGFRSTGGGLNAKVDNFRVEVAYSEGYLYNNTFNTNTSIEYAGIYTTGKTNTISDGCFNLEANTNAYLSEVVGASAWTDYTVEADVMLIQPEGDTTTKGNAGIAARSTNKKDEGYEFRMYYNGNGTTQLQLMKRNGAEGDLGESTDLKKTIAFTLNEYHEMKMTVQGNKITCFFDGEEAFTVEDKGTAYTTGYAGFRSTGGGLNAKVDNFRVTEYQEPPVVEPPVVEPPIDDPTDSLPDGYLYYNEFNSTLSMKDEGWSSNSAGEKVDGKYVLKGKKNNYLTGVDDSLKWTNYVVEADVTLHDNGEYPQYTAIAARSKDLKNEGYEFRLITEEDGTHVRLYKRGIDSGRINDKINIINISVIPNEKHTLKMVVEGATITCYFDGVKMFEVTDKNEPYLTGYAGVHSPSGTADSSFEYFAVRNIGDADIVKDTVITKQDGDIWFFDDFMGEESMTERGWSTDKVAIRNGAALITTRVVADKIEGADKWTDYEVSAIVYVDKAAGITNEKASSGASTVVARSLSSTTGYEFGIISSPTAASYIRLYDRKNGVDLAEDKTTKITEGEHELRMVCIGKEIYCYLDGKLVFAAQSDSATAGYAGVRAINYNTYYKDFTVRKARPVTTTIRPSGTVSPVTGDTGINGAVMYAAALVLSLSMIGLVVTATYSRKRR